MRALGQHNLVTWQRWGGILPQLPAGSLLNSLGFVCFHACVYNESVFVLCLLGCFVWGGVMRVFISAVPSSWFHPLASEMTQCRCLLCSGLNTYSHLCRHSCTITGRDEHFDTSFLSLGPSGFLFSFFTFFFLVHRLLPNTFVLLLHIHTHIYTHRCPGLSLGLRATQNDMCWVPAAWFPLLIHTLALR